MLLAAADLGIGNIFIWGTAAAVNADPSLALEAGIPEGYKPLATVALGYPEQEVTERPFERKIAISRV
jgi:nitroreductase